MNDSPRDSAEALTAAIARYNEAWNAHDLDAIVAMDAADMVFANHTAREAATGADVRAHIGSVFAAWPDIAFTTQRLYFRDAIVTQEWTAAATHVNTMRRGE